MNLSIFSNSLPLECTAHFQKTAEILHVSQPTLTRNMKLLEKEFGVILFARSKNHIALNENGLLAIKEARKILSEIEVMTDKVRQLDRSRHTLSLGSCAPYLSWTLYG